MKSRFLVLTGDGINCASETAWAFELAGGQSEIIHINDLLHRPEALFDFDGIVFPGGFSFGDDLGSGQVMALKIRHTMWVEIQSFVHLGAPILGVCNGFQVLSKLGLLPIPTGDRVMALAPNAQGHFINRWVDLECPSHSICKWTQGLDSVSLPIRHAEGRVVFPASQASRMVRHLDEQGQIALKYTEDVNGSYERIAGICDPTGLILGLMPHPEAHLFAMHRPVYTDTPFAEGAGLQLFQNIVNHLKDRESTCH